MKIIFDYIEVLKLIHEDKFQGLIDNLGDLTDQVSIQVKVNNLPQGYGSVWIFYTVNDESDEDSNSKHELKFRYNKKFFDTHKLLPPKRESEIVWDLPKESFERYVKVQIRGKFNMLTESSQAAKEANLKLSDFMEIQTNYRVYLDLYPDVFPTIEKEYMEELLDSNNI